MLITRSPLRISLGGGGTDLPSYYEERGGFLVAAAIDKYVWVTIHRPFVPGVFLKYSEIERANRVEDIKHPIVREAFAMMGITELQHEITTLADIPAGTGLGSSGSFTTALLKALYSFERRLLLDADVARLACELEIERLAQPVGKQDQVHRRVRRRDLFRVRQRRQRARRAARDAADHAARARRSLAVVLHWLLAQRERDLERSKRQDGSSARQVDGREPRPRQGPRPAQPARARARQARAIRRDHARALGAQTRSLEWDVEPEDRRVVRARPQRRRDRRQARRCRRRRLLDVLRARSRTACARRWRPRASKKFASASTSTARESWVRARCRPSRSSRAGSRRASATSTKTIPKALVDVAGRPFIAHQLALLCAAGVTRVVLCIAHFAEQIEAVLGDGRALGLEIAYSRDELEGTGGALRRALPLLGERFLVVYGDSYLRCDYAAIARAWTASGKLGLMTVYRNDGRYDASNVEFTDHIVRYSTRRQTRRHDPHRLGPGGVSRRGICRLPRRQARPPARLSRSARQRPSCSATRFTERFYEIGSHAGPRRHPTSARKDLSRP